MNPKLNPTIFRDAAVFIDNGLDYFCCIALGKLQLENGLTANQEVNKGPAIELFTEWFKPSDLLDDSFAGWWGYPDQEAQQARILALLFMGEIFKDLQRAERKAQP
jgi:hypothetical protein